MTNDGEELLAAQDALQAEAEEVVAALELERTLTALGDPVRTGSSALGLMRVRDIDITVVCAQLDARAETAVARLGADLATHPHVRQVTFRDDTGRWNTDPAYPDGLYLGVGYRAPQAEDWNLDIWFVDEPKRQPDLAHVRSLPQRLTAEARLAILRIKQDLVRREVYGRDVRSFEVYTAVLDHGVRTVEEFEQRRKKM